MNDTQASNGLATAELVAQIVREVIDQQKRDRLNDIPFGDQPNHAFTPLWAEGMLRELFAQHPQVFAACLTAYTTGIRQAPRGRKPQGVK